MNLNALESDTWNFSERLSLTGDECFVNVDDMLYLRYHHAKCWLDTGDLKAKNQFRAWRPTGPATDKNEYLIGYQGELEHFARSVLEGKEPSSSLKDGVEALRIAEAIWESVTTGKVMRL